jgi:hypothetical protein
MPTVQVQLTHDELGQLRRIAKKEVRTVEQQIAYFLRQGIDAYWRAYYRRQYDQENDREDEQSSADES